MADRDTHDSQYWMDPDGAPLDAVRPLREDEADRPAFDGTSADPYGAAPAGAYAAGGEAQFDGVRDVRDVRETRDEPAHAETVPDTAAIRADIRDTRERLGETLEQIGERLNPQRLTQQVQHTIRDATIGRVEHMARHAADRVTETSNSVVDTIRENPIPAAMIGVGLGWLLLNRRRPEPRYDRTYEARYGAAYPGAYGTAYGSTGGYTSREETSTLDRARGAAGDLGHTVRDAAGDVVERTQHAAADLADRTQHVAADVAMQTRRQTQRLEDRFQEQPLALGAATLALGLAAGMSLPVSDREVQLMGDARDRVVDRVREVAEETRDKVQHVATRVVDEVQHTARDAAREEGLLSQPAAQPSASGMPGQSPGQPPRPVQAN